MKPHFQFSMNRVNVNVDRMNVAASAKNQVIAALVEIIICTTIVRVIEGVIKHVKLMNI